LQGFLFQVEVSKIVVHEADEPMPSSTSLMPSFWPANTTEMLIFLRCRQGASASGDDDVAVVEGMGQFGRAGIGAC
jgi:hypothetical protein